MNQFVSVSLLRRVGRIVCSFVHSVSFPVVVNHGSQSLSRSESAPPSFSFKQIPNAQFSAESVRLSWSLVLILKRITIVQWCKQSSINTHKFLLAEERMFRIGMLLPGWLSWLLSPRAFTAKHSHWTNGDSWVSAPQRLVVGGAGSRVSENERYERDKLKWGIRSVRSC